MSLTSLTIGNLNMTGNMICDGSPGTIGYVLTKTGTYTQSFQPLPSSTLAMQIANPNSISINTGTPIFTGGSVVENINSPFTFNALTGGLTADYGAAFNFNLRTNISTHDVQSKLVMSRNGNPIAIQEIDYVPSLTTEQPFAFQFMGQFAQNDVVNFAFTSFGIGGTATTSGTDVTYGLATTILYINKI